MGQQGLWIAVVVAVAMTVFPFNCLATEYTVGDSAQWTLGANYKTWASGKTFVVGDKLVFKYTPGTHNTLVVNKAAYDGCLTTNPLATHTSGNDTITLDSTGAKYYICGITGHCSAGMKLTVTVGAASTSKKNGTAPSPSPARSRTPTVQSPSPSSASPTAPTVGSPSPSSTAPATPTIGAPSPSSAANPPSVQTPSSSTNGASTASPSYRMGAVLLLGGSLLLAMGSS